MVWVVYLSQTLGAPPVSLGDVVERWDQTEGVVAVVTAVAQQEAVLCRATATHQTHVLVHLVAQTARQTGVDFVD